MTWIAIDESHLAEYTDPPNCERLPKTAKLGPMKLDGELAAAILGESAFVLSGPADESSAGGLDVAEGEDVAGRAECCFGLIEQAERERPVLVLEGEPASMDLGYGDELWRFGALGCRPATLR